METPAQKPVVEGHYEGVMVATVLRRCPKCHSAHPRARGIPSDTCECGQHCGEPEHFDADETVITGRDFRLRLANALLKAGAHLNRLVKGPR